ncbi:MAG: N-6 DNA methylase [Cyanobacteria bacterium REEB65]|nr:N-6 DNA methylase [Cyanobacteria bacterium REEB65]
MMARTAAACVAVSDRQALLEVAADRARALYPDALIPESRRTEVGIYLAACGLESRILGGSMAPRLEAALIELGGCYRPLLQDDVTRRRIADAARSLAGAIESVLASVDWTAEDGELLGSWFEGGLASGQRKRLGQYYTPSPIVEFLLDRALCAFDPRRGPLFRVLDPACGAGHFLGPAALRLFERYRECRDDLAALRPGEAWDDVALIHRVFTHHLVGVDIDPFAARVARIRLRLLACQLGAEGPVQPVILHGDALAPDGGPASLPELEQRFGAVVGNPPYGAQIAADVTRRFQLGRGRCDSTALFIERALDLAAPGGRVAFVVPHGVTRTGAYAPCRAMLADRAELLALLDAGQAFTGVNLEAMAFVARRPDPGSPQPPIELWTSRFGALTPLGEQAPGFYRDRPTLPIYVPGDLGTLVARLERQGTPLSQLCRIRRGSAISARHPGLSAEPIPGGVRVVRGRDISRYAEMTDLFELGPQDDLFGSHAGEALGCERVAYQNIASGIVATRLPKGVLPLDTVNVLEPKAQVDELALLAFLNSRLADWYFKVAISNMAQLTVHLDCPTLGSLRVILGDPAPLAEQARILLAARKAKATSPDQLDTVAQAIDEAIFDRAGLSSSQRAVILQATRPTLWRSGRSRSLR